jgi:hypothetical protein
VKVANDLVANVMDRVAIATNAGITAVAGAAGEVAETAASVDAKMSARASVLRARASRLKTAAMATRSANVPRTGVVAVIVSGITAREIGIIAHRIRMMQLLQALISKLASKLPTNPANGPRNSALTASPVVVAVASARKQQSQQRPTW